MTHQTNLDFDLLPYERIAYEPLATAIRKARLHLRLAFSAGAALKVVDEFQALLRQYETHATLARIRHIRRTQDPFYAAEVAYYDETDAKINQMTQSFYTTLLESAHRAELEIKLGSHLFRIAQNLREIMQPGVIDDIAEENRLTSAYQQHMASALISLNGEQLAISQLQPLMQSPDRLVRQQAHQALADWLQTESQAIERIFDQLVAVRTRISRKLGKATFSELGYLRLERFDITRSQIETLRAAIVRYIVPLSREIRRLQKHRLGLEHLYYFDLPCLLPEGNPRLAVATSELPAASERILARLTGDDPSFMQALIDGGYMDIEARPGKVQGRRCQVLPDSGRPFIFMNASGVAQDAATLMHEAGHAYAGIRSLPGARLLEYRRPPPGIRESLSTAMEFLSYPHMDRCFGERAEDYTMLHMTETLLSIPYGCLVDEFLHRVYDQPRLTSSQRREIWRELESLYLPDLDYGEEPCYTSGCSWMLESQLFLKPFSLFDDVIARIIALEIWQQAREEPAQAWQIYDKLCSLGGRDNFSRLLEQARLRSPFDIGTVKVVAYAAARFMEL